jgi:hypothetical protein
MVVLLIAHRPVLVLEKPLGPPYTRALATVSCDVGTSQKEFKPIIPSDGLKNK